MSRPIGARAAAISIAGVALCLAGQASGQAPDVTQKHDPATPVEVPIPESPAAAVLGGTGTILRPSTAQEFAVSLANNIDKSGKIKPNLSLEISPYLLFNRGRPIDGYGAAVDPNKSKAAGRTVLYAFPLNPVWTLANTTLSVATGAKEGGDFAKRAAVGVKVPLFDEGDPRLNYAFSKCIVEEVNPNHPAPAIGPTSFGATDKTPQRIAAETACATKANKVHWNRTAAAFAFAQSYLDTGDEKKANLTRDARTAWFSYAWGYNLDMTKDTKATTGKGAGQIVVQLKDIRNAFEAASDSSTASTTPGRYNSTSGYLRWRFGSDTLNFDVSASQERRKHDDGRRDKVRLIAAGAEFKWLDYWLLLTFGRENSEIAGNKAFVLANFKWGFNRENSIAPR